MCLIFSLFQYIPIIWGQAQGKGVLLKYKWEECTFFKNWQRNHDAIITTIIPFKNHYNRLHIKTEQQRSVYDLSCFKQVLPRYFFLWNSSKCQSIIVYLILLSKPFFFFAPQQIVPNSFPVLRQYLIQEVIPYWFYSIPKDNYLFWC